MKTARWNHAGLQILDNNVKKAEAALKTENRGGTPEDGGALKPSAIDQEQPQMLAERELATVAKPLLAQ